MQDLAAYIDSAESTLSELLKSWRPKLMAGHGITEFDLKADKSVVTKLDGELELAIKDALRPLNAEIGFLGEEYGPDGPQDIFWTVDPIDGTEQYIRGMPSCRTLLCLIVDGQPYYALAYRFTTDDMFTAVKGKGLLKNGQPIVMKQREFRRAWIEFSYDIQDSALYERVKSVHTQIGSVMYAHEFLNMIEGFIDGYVVYKAKGKVWDYAPRALLLMEAGARVTNFGKDAYDYTDLSIIATHPANYDELAALLSPQA